MIFRTPTDSTKVAESYIAHIRVTEDVAHLSSPAPANSAPENDHNKKVRFIIIALRKLPQVLIHKARENSNGTFSIGKTWSMDDLVAIYSHGAEGSNTPAEGFTLFLNEPRYWQADTEDRKIWFLRYLISVFAKNTKGDLPKLVGFELKERAWALATAARYRDEAVNLKNRPREEPLPDVPRQSDASTNDTDLAETSVLPTSPTTTLISDIVNSTNRSAPGGSYNLPSDSGPSSSPISIQKVGDGDICPVCKLDYNENADVLLYSCGKHSAHVECGGQSYLCPIW